MYLQYFNENSQNKYVRSMRKNRIFVVQIAGKGSVKMTEPNKYVFVLRRFIGTANAFCISRHGARVTHLPECIARVKFLINAA